MKDELPRSGLRVCSQMRLVARELRPGRLSTTVVRADTDLVTADVLTVFSFLTAASFSVVEAIEVPKPLSDS